MKPNKRNGREAKLRRQIKAKDRRIRNNQFFDAYVKMTPEERLITAIFGAFTECPECGNDVLVKTDCQSPHCKSLREEKSEFYEEVTEDYIVLPGGETLWAGVDY